jgi:hypothetical protein
MKLEPEPTRNVTRDGMGAKRSYSEGKDEWLTPPRIIEALGPFDLDPCAPIVRPWPTAAEHYTIVDNGLRLTWRGRVWLNPPYGKETGKWLGRLAEHRDGIALIFARTETEDWFTHVWAKASAVFFLRGRLRFHHVNGAPGRYTGGAPSALIAYGDYNAGRLRVSGLKGKFVEL